jgi:UDP-N-acetyl-D-mannosaminuronic acid dehydrogenase
LLPVPAEAKQTVTVVGLGYIGLPTAALMASSGLQVTGIDVSAHVVETVNKGLVHIEENDLDALVQAVVAGGTLRASTAMVPADVFVVAVPTPITADNAPDTTYVLSAARAIAPVLAKGNLVILESTSPVGTTDAMCALFAELRPDLAVPGHSDGAGDIHVAYCPERVLPGRILIELVDNDRCIGGITSCCAAKAASFYRQFVKGECIETTARAAEMVKLVENSYRDVNIAFANELSMVAETMKVDVWEVIRLANRHPRVNILQPGPGVGGHCIAVDPWFIVHGDPENSNIIRTAREVNLAKTERVTEKAVALIEAHPDARIACLGLAFKPNIDDFRESPALEIAERLAHRFGNQIAVVEPYATALPKAFEGSGAVLVPLDEALGQCEVLILLVDHDVFKAIPLDRRSSKAVYDTRGIWQDQASI